MFFFFFIFLFKVEVISFNLILLWPSLSPTKSRLRRCLISKFEKIKITKNCKTRIKQRKSDLLTVLKLFLRTILNKIKTMLAIQNYSINTKEYKQTSFNIAFTLVNIFNMTNNESNPIVLLCSFSQKNFCLNYNSPLKLAHNLLKFPPYIYKYWQEYYELPNPIQKNPKSDIETLKILFCF